MNHAIFNGSACRDESLPRDLAAKHALSFLVGLGTAKEVEFERFEIEIVDQSV
jgi:hypothetical protein